MTKYNLCIIVGNLPKCMPCWILTFMCAYYVKNKSGENDECWYRIDDRCHHVLAIDDAFENCRMIEVSGI